MNQFTTSAQRDGDRAWEGIALCLVRSAISISEQPFVASGALERPPGGRVGRRLAARAVGCLVADVRLRGRVSSRRVSRRALNRNGGA